MGKRKGIERRNARINTSFSTRAERLLGQIGIAIEEQYVAGVINRLTMYCIENPWVIEHFMLEHNRPNNAHNRISGFKRNSRGGIEYRFGPQEKRYVYNMTGASYVPVEINPYDDRYETATATPKQEPQQQR